MNFEIDRVQMGVLLEILLNLKITAKHDRPQLNTSLAASCIYLCDARRHFKVCVAANPAL